MTEVDVASKTQSVVDIPDHISTGCYYTGQRGWGYMWILGFIGALLCSIDWMTATYIPLTIRHFTDNMFWITFLPGTLHRMFGMCLQPYVAWKGDQIQTPYGRRRPFFLFASPFAFAALLVVGAMPSIFSSPTARLSVLALGCLIVANFILQIFDEICLGCLDPLFADTYQQKKLGRMYAVRSYANLIVNATLTFVALKWLAGNLKWEFGPYAISSVFVLMAFFLMLFLVRENYHAPRESQNFLDLFTSLRLLKDINYLKLAIITSTGLILPATWMICSALFVTQTLGLNKSQFADLIGWCPLVGLATSFPIGYLVDRYGPRYILAVGFIATAILNAVMAYFVHDFYSFLIVNLINGGVAVMILVPIGPLIFEHALPHERGKIFGMVQFVRAFATFLISFVIGIVVQSSRSTDPTPIYSDDLKDPAGIAKHILNPANAFDHYLSQTVKSDLLAQIKPLAQMKNKDITDPKKAPLLAALNAEMSDAALYAPGRYPMDKLSGQSKSLILARKNENQLKVFNRSLMQDMFPTELSTKRNLRLSYSIAIPLALIAGLISLRARRGKNAQQTVLS